MASKDETRSPDLQKLEEKLRKDPTSKLFFPLAEEYTRAGRLDAAIGLLRTGIKAHPDFLGARVALGKALLSKGKTAEAKAEFEQVIAANPDNLMAHKKLAGIYLAEGEKGKALASCEAILAVNPTDPEVVRLRDEISRLPDVRAEDESTVRAQMPLESSAEAEATVIDRQTIGNPSEPTVTMVEPTVVEPTLVEPTEVVGLAGAESGEPTEVVRAPDEPAESAAVVGSGEVGEAADEDLATLSLADLYVAQGHYQRGIAIYRRLLERSPNDPDISAKLDNALTLDRLLAPPPVDADSVKSDVVHHVLSGSEAPASEPEAEAFQPSLAGASTGASRHQAVIERLEVWLARIAERRRR